MKYEPRRILALLLLFVTITGLVVSFGENVLCAGELPGVHDVISVSAPHDPAQAHDIDCCPCAPSPAHSTSDHFCTGDCGCPCHAPLTSPAITLTHSRTFTYLFHTELTRYIPEVYLSLFVPPDSITA
jgi:hypothetical protein